MSVTARIIIEWPDSVTKEDAEDAVSMIFCGCIPGLPSPISANLDEFEGSDT